jgi:hypothetical protein
MKRYDGNVRLPGDGGTMTRLLPLLLLAAPLVACDRGASDPTPAKPIEVRSAAQDRLHQLDELNRAIALKRAVRDSGSSCLRVTSAGFVGRYKNMDYWTASCEDEFDRVRDWALFIGADDSVQVRLCKDVAEVGLPACKSAATPAG